MTDQATATKSTAVTKKNRPPRDLGVALLLVAIIVACAGGASALYHRNETPVVADPLASVEPAGHDVPSDAVATDEPHGEITPEVSAPDQLADAGDLSEAPEVTKPAAETKPVQVRTVEVEPYFNTVQIRERGVLEPFVEITVYSDLTGRVVQRHVGIGDRVEEGDPVVELDDKLLEIKMQQAEAKNRAAAARYADAKNRLGRVERSGNSQEVVDAKNNLASSAAASSLAQTELAEATEQYERRIVRSPVSGTVSATFVDQGEYAGEAKPVAEVVRTDKLRVRLGLTPTQVLSLGEKSEAAVKLIGGASAGLGEPLPAKLLRAAPKVDPQTRRVRVELEIDNAAGKMWPGMDAEVIIDARGEGQGTLRIPRSAVTTRDDELVCFRVIEKVDGEDPFWELQLVNLQVKPTLGNSAMLDVRAGLEPGDRIVVGNLDELRDGMHVTE